MAAKQPPPPMKKHSQTDLVSLLKTRKILGVGGEDDDGEVHHSKIRQGLAACFCCALLWHGYYGISLIMWNSLYRAEKVIIRWTLLTEACYFSVQFLVVTATLAETGLVSLGILLLLASSLLFVAISVYYCYQVGRKPKKA
ncbi:tumor protein p53-inducible protein 11-like isoform X2 [Hippopotamus amphibius kiboko]|uniref:tumor protein p53-inducible protein 11-like isoform X2 n=1 Tax=Hippopotamus amphibius kiboko TaxID=575201 RepID=UPI00259704AE|nr:tumor protein p53-inducible protein 11-like isoform X2 [Hippopotamus amphibius kiboko]